MANPEHVQLVLQKDWNKWRTDHGGIALDLSRANLIEADLGGANLGAANLGGAKLSAAKLDEADLGGAKLNGADLSGANLSGAKLIGAILIGANFGWAKLNAADLSGAKLDRTNFGAAILNEANGLADCNFSGPCILDHRAIQLSGRLPLEFLRGCGLPDTLIDYLPPLLNEAIQFFSCFISYSTKDQEFADRLYADLQNKGVRCWFAPHDIRGGRKIDEQIDEAIRLYDKLLLILSDASMNSEWVVTEISKARKRERLEKRRMLFPLGLAPFRSVQDWECFDADVGKDSAREIREYFIPDFSKWKDYDSYRTAFERLLRDLKADSLSAKV